MAAIAVRAGAAGLLLAAAILAAVPPAFAATSGPRPPFAATVADAALVVVGRVVLAPDRITVSVERVLAGTGPAAGRLEFEHPVAPPALVDGGRAVIAFADPTSIEAAAPTTAWPISEEGFADPEDVATTEGLPPTLAAMYTWFGIPMAAERAGGGTDLPAVLVPVLLVLVALAMAEGGIARRERRLRGRHVP